MMFSLVLSLTCGNAFAAAMPEPVPATQTDKQKAAAQKKKEAEKKKKEAEKAKAAKEKQKAAAAKQKEAEKKKAAAAKANEQKQKEADKKKAEAAKANEQKQKEADKKKAEAAKANEQKQKEAAKAQAKQQAEREKAAAERAKQAEERQAAATKRETEKQLKEQQQLIAWQKQQDELANPRTEVVSYFNLGLRAGYSAMMDKFNGKYMGAGTLNQSNAFQQLKGGGGAGLNLTYNLEYSHFLFETGLDFRFLNSTSAYGFQATRTTTNYPYTDPATGATLYPSYGYWFDNLTETRNMLGIGVPVMFGAQFSRYYFLLGAKIHYNLPMGYSQKGKYDIVVNDPALVDPYGMGIHDINGQTNTKMTFKPFDLSLAAEVGLDLDEWLQQQPDPEKQKKQKIKPGQRLPFGREHVHYRVSLFAEYGVMNNNATPEANPVEFAGNDILVQRTNTLLAMNGDTKLNNLFVGAKFTIQFEVPGRKQRQLPPPPSYAEYSVIDAATGQPLQVAFVETTSNNGKIARREKQIGPKGFRQKHPLGVYTSVAKADGYYDATEHFEVEQVGATSKVVIRMNRKPIFRVRVTNKETGAALPAAVEIRVRGTEQPAYTIMTDSVSGAGRQELAEGQTYSLYIAQMGYETLEMQINSVGDSMNVQINPVKKGEVFIMKNMFFATNKTRILSISEQSLQDLFMYLERNPEVRIRIIGHTDNIGKDAANQKLSEGRAKAVRDDLIERGVAPERIQSEGRGESQPIDTNDTEEGRQNNRRVEIEIL